MTDREMYQELYDKLPKYGAAEHNACPGVRLLPQYKHWLRSPVVDLGCGRGDTVRALQKTGIECIGYDQISCDPDMQIADITMPLGFTAKSVICMDVIEHIPDDELDGLFENLKLAPRQAFSIHNGPSSYTGIGEYSGKQLHVNRKPFGHWKEYIRGHGLKIHVTVTIHADQRLFLTSFNAG